MIIGSAGSGKSTAARLIGEKLGLPVFHMDREVYWLPGWVELSQEDRVRQVEWLVAKDAWVFEGSYSSTFHLREARADMVIWLQIPLAQRLFRVIRRSITQRGKARPDMADGCVEKLSMLPGFLHFIVTTNSRAKRKQAAFFEKTALPKGRFKTTKAFNDFVAALPSDDTNNRTTS